MHVHLKVIFYDLLNWYILIQTVRVRFVGPLGMFSTYFYTTAYSDPNSDPNQNSQKLLTAILLLLLHLIHLLILLPWSTMLCSCPDMRCVRTKGDAIGGNIEMGFGFSTGGSGVIMASCMWILFLQCELEYGMWD